MNLTPSINAFFESRHNTIGNTSNSINNVAIQSSSPVPLVKMLSNILLYAGIAIFVVSLFFNVFFTNTNDVSGIWVLLTGWLGFIVFQFAWFANPLSILAILLMKQRPLVSLLLIILAVILASEMFLFNEIPAASGDDKIYIKEFGLGAYTWYASHWLVLYSMLLNIIAHKA